MKISMFGLESCHIRLALAALSLAFLGISATAAETSPQSDEPNFNNWINPTFGGLIIKGNQAQFQQANPTTGPVYGGIEDMHYQQDLKNNTVLKIDGHALFYNNDYKLILELSKQDLGYFKAGYTGFTSYFNGNGGYLAATPGLPNTMQPGGMFFGGPEYGLYRGSLWAEIGLRKENLPELTFRYEHNIRNGQEDTTTWGGAATGATARAAGGSADRKIVPGFWNMNEVRDIFSFKGKQLFGKPESFGNTEVNVGANYEAYNQNDSLNTHTGVGNTGTGTAGPYYMTQQQNQLANNYNGNLSTVTRFGDKLWVTTGYEYATINTDLGGSRIYGPANGVPYSFNASYVSANGGQFLNLNGGSSLTKNTMLLNVRWEPIDGLEVTPAARLDLVSTVSDSVFLGAGYDPARVPNVTPAGLNPANSHVGSSVLLNDFAQSLDIRYTKLRDWVFYGQATWDQQNENRNYNTPANSPNNYQSAQLDFAANNYWATQKYTGGINWYALPNLYAGAQFFWQFQNIHQNVTTWDNTGNQRLLGQYWNTQDANFRVSWNPFSSVSLVSRYDFQTTHVNSQWAATGNPSFACPSGESSQIKSQFVTESATWTPVDRLFLQGNLSYVINQITSPAMNQNPSLQGAYNNYWTAGAGAGYQLDAKTSLRGDFNIYYANDYQNNEQYGVPYNAAATQYIFSASLNRQVTKNLSWSLKYYFDTYQDRLSGGNNSYTAQIIATSLNMQF